MRYHIYSCATKLNNIELRGLRFFFNSLKKKGITPILISVHNYNELDCIFIKYDLIRLSKKEILYKYLIYLLKKSIFNGAEKPNLEINKWIIRILLIRKDLNFNYAKLLTIINYYFFTDILKKYKNIEKIFVWNNFSVQFGILYDVGINNKFDTGVIERGFVENTFYLSSPSFFFNSNVYKSSLDDLLENDKKGYKILDNRLKFIYKLGDECEFDILVIGNADIDAGAYPNCHYDNQFHFSFFENSIELAKKIAFDFPDKKVVFKPHPLSIEKNNPLINNLYISFDNAVELIEKSEVIVCMGSKLEIQALLRLKKILLAGSGWSYNKNIVLEVNSFNKLKIGINQLLQKDSIDKNTLKNNVTIYANFLIKNFFLDLAQKDGKYYTKFIDNMNKLN